MSAESPKLVNRFEANLLRLARAAFRPMPAAEISRIVWNAPTAPPCLSPNAIALLKDTLAKGCLTFLIRAGGWRGERGLANPDAPAGPIWERTPPADRPLRFTRALPELLIALAANWPAEFAARFASVSLDSFGPSDQLVLMRLYHSLRSDSELVRILRALPIFRDNALVAIAFPDDFETAPDHLDWEPWLRGGGAMILDSIQPWLALRWKSAERDKGSQKAWALLEAAGTRHAAILEPLLAAARAAGRIDLVRFLPRMLAELFGERGLPLAFWTAALAADAAPPRLAERIGVLRSAVAVPRLMETLGEWTREFRGVPFFDEGYAAAQWWLADWERYNGERTLEQARHAVREAEPL